MKKYKAHIYDWSEGYRHCNSFIHITNHVVIQIDSSVGHWFKSKSSAKRAAERVAKKLGIGLIWTK